MGWATPLGWPSAGRVERRGVALLSTLCDIGHCCVEEPGGVAVGRHASLMANKKKPKKLLQALTTLATNCAFTATAHSVKPRWGPLLAFAEPEGHKGEPHSG